MMVSTSTTDQFPTKKPIMESTKIVPAKTYKQIVTVSTTETNPKVIQKNKENISLKDESNLKTAEFKKKPNSPSDDKEKLNGSSSVIDDTDAETSSLDSNQNGSSIEEIKVFEQNIEKKVKRKFYWYGSHKLVKPIKDIPPRFQVMLAETNAEKARCEGRPIILQQHMDLCNPNEIPLTTTPFNPDAQCFIPHQAYNNKLCSDGKDNSLVTTSNGSHCSGGSSGSSDVIAAVNGGNIPFTPAPMYTIHIYNSPNSPAGTTAVATTATSVTSSPCCMHLPGICSSPYVSTSSQPPVQAPIYYTSHPYTQQTYATAQYPPSFVRPANTAGQSIQFASCIAYSQNAQYS